LPGMQSAFVDLGLERDTFLYVSDFFEEHGEDIDTVKTDEKPAGRFDRRDRGQNRPPRERPAEVRPVDVAEAAPADIPQEVNGDSTEAGMEPVQREAEQRPPEQIRTGERPEGDRGQR